MRVYFASAENLINRVLGSKFPHKANLFCTFFYCAQTISFFKKMGPITRPSDRGYLVVDSGAHTFFGEHGIAAVETYKKEHKKKTTLNEVELYFRRYISFLKKFYDYYDFFCELDLQEIFGTEKILEWRALLKKEGLFKKCITCFHTGDSQQFYDDMIANSESRYIALQGLRLGEKPLDYSALIKQAYESDCRVHGFAFTRSKLLMGLPFYSVDSSSFTMPVRYGGSINFSENSVTKKTGASHVKSVLKNNLHVNFLKKRLKITEIAPVLLHSMGEFLKYEKHMTSLWERRGIKWRE